jgi:hypothetical protein
VSVASCQGGKAVQRSVFSVRRSGVQAFRRSGVQASALQRRKHSLFSRSSPRLISAASGVAYGVALGVRNGRLGLKVPTVLAAGELTGGAPQDESNKPTSSANGAKCPVLIWS